MQEDEKQISACKMAEVWKANALRNEQLKKEKEK